MLRLVSRYRDRPGEQWPGLFYRIVENRIKDLQRHRSVRQRVLARLPSLATESGSAGDPLERVADPAAVDPARALAGDAAMAALGEALATLPARQREAFALRALHELSVEAAASAMGVTAGSVKTHYSRALTALRAQLGEHWS
jgi:RNA polymerase sigma-70 factor (ECF subfamily)